VQNDHKCNNITTHSHIIAHAISKHLQYTGCSLQQQASDYVTTRLLHILHELTAFIWC